MKLYDGTSDIDWFYDGPKTRAEMDGDTRYPQDGRAVLHDDGAGKAYSWQLLDVLCDAYGVTKTEDARADFDAVATAMEEIPPDRAEQALEIAETAQQAADEAKGAVADATSAAQTAAEAAATAQTTADEAKTTADTAAASVNEYMDALLGLGATSETEATDAE